MPQRYSDEHSPAFSSHGLIGGVRKAIVSKLLHGSDDKSPNGYTSLVSQVNSRSDYRKFGTNRQRVEDAPLLYFIDVFCFFFTVCP